MEKPFFRGTPFDLGARLYLLLIPIIPYERYSPPAKVAHRTTAFSGSADSSSFLNEDANPCSFSLTYDLDKVVRWICVVSGGSA